MTNNISKEEKPNTPAAPAGVTNNHRQDGWRHPHNCWNNTANPLPIKFEGKTKEINGDIFGNIGPSNMATFNCLFKNIADYLQLVHENNV